MKPTKPSPYKRARSLIRRMPSVSYHVFAYLRLFAITPGDMETLGKGEQGIKRRAALIDLVEAARAYRCARKIAQDVFAEYEE